MRSWCIFGICLFLAYVIQNSHLTCNNFMNMKSVHQLFLNQHVWTTALCSSHDLGCMLISLIWSRCMSRLLHCVEDRDSSAEPG